MRLALVTAFLISGVASVYAGPCESNFSTSGVPMLTGISFRTWQAIPGVKPAVALDNLAKAAAAQGFHGVRVNKALGSVDAFQETSGSGRSQSLRLTARASGKGTRVDAVFEIQQGQLADGAVVREGLCEMVSSAGGM